MVCTHEMRRIHSSRRLRARLSTFWQVLHSVPSAIGACNGGESCNPRRLQRVISARYVRYCCCTSAPERTEQGSNNRPVTIDSSPPVDLKTKQALRFGAQQMKPVVGWAGKESPDEVHQTTDRVATAGLHRSNVPSQRHSRQLLATKVTAAAAVNSPKAHAQTHSKQQEQTDLNCKLFGTNIKLIFSPIIKPRYFARRCALNTETLILGTVDMHYNTVLTNLGSSPMNNVLSTFESPLRTISRK